VKVLSQKHDPQTADEIDPKYRGKAVQAWLARDQMNMAALA